MLAVKSASVPSATAAVGLRGLTATATISFFTSEAGRITSQSFGAHSRTNPSGTSARVLIRFCAFDRR